ncbi:MAG: hypothetical protein LUQ38_11580 [Methanotrichaceae archaeon]|nr:hypothetical protein [Methanotrichaceae archaeon]
MKKELVLALVIAISLGGAMLAMAGNSNEDQSDSQNTNDKFVTCERLCEGGVCSCIDPAANVSKCDTNGDGRDDCWCEESTLTTCLLPLKE